MKKKRSHLTNENLQHIYVALSYTVWQYIHKQNLVYLYSQMQM